jgi:hypothetical protein
VDRRAFVAGTLVFLAAPRVMEAQPTVRVPRVGVVSAPPHDPSPTLEAFRQGLRELGYVEGQNVRLEVRQ